MNIVLPHSICVQAEALKRRHLKITRNLPQVYSHRPLQVTGKLLWGMDSKALQLGIHIHFPHYEGEQSTNNDSERDEVS